jgi:hypothetical protein
MSNQTYTCPNCQKPTFVVKFKRKGYAAYGDCLSCQQSGRIEWPAKPQPALLVCDGRCDECLFGPDNIVRSKERIREIIDDCLTHDRWFECHKGTIAGVNVCCRGFYDIHGADVWPLRLAQMVDKVIFVPVPEKEI